LLRARPQLNRDPLGRSTSLWRPYESQSAHRLTSVFRRCGLDSWASVVSVGFSLLIPLIARSLPGSSFDLASQAMAWLLLLSPAIAGGVSGCFSRRNRVITLVSITLFSGLVYPIALALKTSGAPGLWSYYGARALPPLALIAILESGVAGGAVTLLSRAARKAAA
jgi:hypothetical protein